MRRSCFYMNQRFTQRHLNAIRSPLLTGYVNTLSGTSHAAALLNPPSLAACSVAASTTAAAMSDPVLADYVTATGLPMTQYSIAAFIQNLLIISPTSSSVVVTRLLVSDALVSLISGLHGP